MKLKTTIVVLASCAALLGSSSVYAGTSDADDKSVHKASAQAAHSKEARHKSMETFEAREKEREVSQRAFLKGLNLSKEQLAKISTINESIEKKERARALADRKKSKVNFLSPITDELAVSLSIAKALSESADFFMRKSHGYSAIFHDVLNKVQQEKVMKEVKKELSSSRVYVVDTLLYSPETLQRESRKHDSTRRHLPSRHHKEKVASFDSQEMTFIKDLALSKSQLAEIKALHKTKQDMKLFIAGQKLLNRSMADLSVSRLEVDQLSIKNEGLWAGVLFSKLKSSRTIFYQVLNKEQQEKVLIKMKEKRSRDNEVAGGNVIGAIYEAPRMLERAVKKAEVK
jgi:Spy/CpxP family protein refolding chaperone